MENNNTEEFNFEGYNDFLSKIKVGSPVHKINFTIENPNAVVGMHLVTMKNVKSYLDKIADRRELKDDTLLVFESRHVIECCQIIVGCLVALESIGFVRISTQKIIEKIIEALLSKPSFYSKVSIELDNIVIDSLKLNRAKDEDKIFDNFKCIMQNIWFVPYGKIDEIANEAMKEFEARTKGGESNE